MVIAVHKVTGCPLLTFITQAPCDILLQFSGAIFNKPVYCIIIAKYYIAHNIIHVMFCTLLNTVKNCVMRNRWPLKQVVHIQNALKFS